MMSAILGAFAVAVAAVDVPNVRIGADVEMPMLAFGSCRESFQPPCSVQQGVEQWLRLGGRHIDTAHDYGTQPDVGRALNASGVPRGDVFITTKVPGPIGKQNVTDMILQSTLPQLGTEYVDLVLIHYPCMGDTGQAPCRGAKSDLEAEQRRETWEGLSQLRSQGKIRAIGVSNFDMQQVSEILAAFKEAPAVNQVQFHLGCYNETFIQAMKDVGTVPQAWASLGGPTVHGSTPSVSLSDKRLQDLALRYNASTAQVALRWETQNGVVPVTATCTASHAIGDMESFAFNLSKADMAYLDALMPEYPVLV